MESGGSVSTTSPSFVAASPESSFKASRSIGELLARAPGPVNHVLPAFATFAPATRLPPVKITAADQPASQTPPVGVKRRAEKRLLVKRSEVPSRS